MAGLIMKMSHRIPLAAVLLVVAGCQSASLPPAAKMAEYTWPDFKLFVEGRKVVGAEYFADHGKCLNNRQKVAARGEYETRAEYEKRLRSGESRDCAAMLDLRQAELRAPVALRYDADHQRFKFTPATGIMRVGTLSSETRREVVWNGGQIVVYMDQFARRPSFRSYIDGRGTDFAHYERDGVRCRSGSKLQYDQDLFPKVHDDTNCHIRYQADRQGGNYVYVPANRETVPQVRVRWFVDSPIDKARTLKEREDKLEIRILGTARLFTGGDNPYQKFDMDHVVGEFTAQKIGLFDTRRESFIVLME